MVTVPSPTRVQQIRERVGLDQALAIVDAVHRAEPGRVSRLIADADLPAVVVLLAAMVDEDRSPADLLAWTDRLNAGALPPLPGQVRLPCGTHAAFNRHRTRGEEPDAACWEAERTYQRLRARQRRHRATAPSLSALEGTR